MCEIVLTVRIAAIGSSMFAKAAEPSGAADAVRGHDLELRAGDGVERGFEDGAEKGDEEGDYREQDDGGQHRGGWWWSGMRARV